MSEPTGADFKLHPGENTDVDGLPPDNDDDPYGGDVNTSIILSTSTPGIAIRRTASLEVDEDYYGALYIGNSAVAPGKLNFAKVYDRAGGQLNLASAQARIWSSSANDAGKKVRLVGKAGSAWNPEIKALTGTTPVFGARTWDIGQLWRAEALSALEVPTYFEGNVIVEVDGQICFVIYGTASTRPVIMASAEKRLALATGLGVTVEGDNRLTAPTGVGSFSRATKWEDEDLSITVPGGEFTNETTLGVAVHVFQPAEIPAPKVGYISLGLAPLGNPEAA